MDPGMPASWPAQTGAQAGHLPEAAGLPAGPGRSPGQAHRGGDGATDGTVTTARSSGAERERENGRGSRG